MEVDDDARRVDEHVEYVSEQLEGSDLEAFSNVFARFQTSESLSAVRLRCPLFGRGRLAHPWSSHLT